MSVLNRIVFVDCETTGLDPCKAEAIQIGACRYKSNGDFQKFQTLVQADNGVAKTEAQKQAQDVHGFTEKEISKNGVSKIKAIKQFAKFCNETKKKTILAGWNMGFDREFLNRLYRDTQEWGGREPYDFHTIDVWTLSWLYTGGQVYSLDDVVEFLDLERDNEHDALQDAILTGEMFLYIRNKIK